MIYKVKIVNQLTVDMAVHHDFEAVIDSDEESFQLGRQAQGYALAFNAGFASASEEEDE